MSQAHTQHRERCAKPANHVDRYAGVLRSSGSWRDQKPVRSEGVDVIQRGLVVPAHRYLCPELAQVLHEVVSKRVVIIDYKDHGSHVVAGLQGPPSLGGAKAPPLQTS